MIFKNITKSKLIVGILLLIFFTCFVFYFFSNKITSSDDFQIDAVIDFEANVSIQEIVKYDEIVNTSIELNNISYCNKIEDDFYSSICKNKVIGCNDDSCFLEIALLEENRLLCDKIIDVDKRNICLDLINYNLVINNVLKSSNITLCKDFNDAQLEQNCLNDFYLNKGLGVDSDKSFCSKISSQELVSFCLEN